MEYGIKARILRILMDLLQQPFHFSKQDLAEIYGVSKDTIETDLAAIKNAGFVLDHDDLYRYKLAESNAQQQLKHLLHFSAEEQLLLEDAIREVAESASPIAEKLSKKLNALYDFGRLGHSYLRKPYLSKLDLLEAAKKEKQQIQLMAYRSSNSNQVSNRKVEAYYFHAAEDMIQAFDVDQQTLRHFRISRIKEIRRLESPWAFEQQHRLVKTDPFRVVNDHQVNVHLRLSVGACNELTERFPLTKAYIQWDKSSEVYEFKAPVNENFYGLINFILGYHHQLVEVIAPATLKTELLRQLQAMQEHWKG